MPTRLIRKRCAAQNTRCHAMLDIEQRVTPSPRHPSNHPAPAISSANPSHPRLLAFLPASSVANLPRTQKKTHPSATHQQPAATRRAAPPRRSNHPKQRQKLTSNTHPTSTAAPPPLPPRPPLRPSLRPQRPTQGYTAPRATTADSARISSPRRTRPAP